MFKKAGIVLVAWSGNLRLPERQMQMGPWIVARAGSSSGGECHIRGKWDRSSGRMPDQGQAGQFDQAFCRGGALQAGLCRALQAECLAPGLFLAQLSAATANASQTVKPGAFQLDYCLSQCAAVTQHCYKLPLYWEGKAFKYLTVIPIWQPSSRLTSAHVQGSHSPLCSPRRRRHFLDMTEGCRLLMFS